MPHWSRRGAVMAAGGFHPRLINAEDFAFWLEVAGQTPIVRVPRVLAYTIFMGVPRPPRTAREPRCIACRLN